MRAVCLSRARTCRPMFVTMASVVDAEEESLSIKCKHPSHKNNGRDSNSEKYTTQKSVTVALCSRNMDLYGCCCNSPRIQALKNHTSTVNGAAPHPWDNTTQPPKIFKRSHPPSLEGKHIGNKICIGDIPLLRCITSGNITSWKISDSNVWFEVLQSHAVKRELQNSV